jgi:pleckstrin homology domain-containing family G member 4
MNIFSKGTKFVSLSDYCAMGNSEVEMKEGDIVELLKIGCAGWWFVKVLGNIFHHHLYFM